MKYNRYLHEALGGGDRTSLYRRCADAVKLGIDRYEKRSRKTGPYRSARDKMKKAGYRGTYMPALYLFLKFCTPVLLFLVALPANYPSWVKPLLLAVSQVTILELVIAGSKKRLNLKLQKYIYKIYKYLHNQISSGVRVSDAVKSVYEIIEDRELRSVLIRVAARYELTSDIDASLDEFRSCFDSQEAETLCVALKQGIMTGDNRELLARQEDVMFKKYFNYIQAETDSCRFRSVLAMIMFVSIVVMMITVPLFKDAVDAVESIFVN